MENCLVFVFPPELDEEALGLLQDSCVLVVGRSIVARM